MNTYNLTLSPSDRKILESKLLDEINSGQDNFVIDEIDRNSGILTFYTNNTLDSDAITEINQYIIDHIPEWDLPVLMQPTTGGEVTADNPLVTANDPIFNTIPHNHSDLNMDDGPNPHGITKSDLSLENVDNTSDIDKPVSTAQQTAINSAQQSAETYADGLIESIKGASPTTLDTLYEIASALQNNPDIITNIVDALGKRVRVDVNNQGLSALEKTNAKTNLSLENVDNTSDANKPISSATQTALNNKENAFSKNSAFNKNFGTLSGTCCEGSDIRLTEDKIAKSLRTTTGVVTINTSPAPTNGMSLVAVSPTEAKWKSSITYDIYSSVLQTTSTTDQLYRTWTTPSLIAGKYLIKWIFRFKAQTYSVPAHLKLKLDGSNFIYVIMAPAYNSSELVSAIAVEEATWSSTSTHTFEAYIRSGSSSRWVEIDHSFIELNIVPGAN